MALDLAQLSTCTRCELSRHRQRVVIGSGPSNPALMVVGEAPGRSEDEGGEPFIGRSGQLLFRLLREEVGITRERCFVTNVVKCRPPNNRAPLPIELDTCWPWFVEQLSSVAPRVVVALGNTAARRVFGFSAAMGTVHGQVRPIGSGQGLATYHPAAVLRGDPRVLRAVRDDLRILKGLVERE